MSARSVIKTVTMNIPNGGSFSVQIWRQDVKKQNKPHNCIICNAQTDADCLLLAITYVYLGSSDDGPMFSACPEHYDDAEAKWSQFHSNMLESYKFNSENAAHQFLNTNLAAAGFVRERVKPPPDDEDPED